MKAGEGVPHAGSAPSRDGREIFRFGEFELRTRPERLLRGGSPVPLQPQPAKALAFFIERAGALVTRDELRAHLWGKSFLEHDQGINFAVRKIRKALDDDTAEPRYLETIPKQGYRFVAPVERLTPPPAGPIELRDRRPGTAWRSWLAALAAIAALTLLGIRWIPQRSTPSLRPSLAILPLEVLALPPAVMEDVMGWPAGSAAGSGTEGVRFALTEEWLAALTNALLERADVIAVDPSVREDGARDPLEVARDLQADWVVRGQLAPAADGAELVFRTWRVPDRVTLWAARFDVQADTRLGIFGAAAAQLGSALDIGHETSVPVESPAVPDATYSRYLQGRALIMAGAYSNDEEKVGEGIAILDDVVSEAPGFGPAHAALSHAHLMSVGLTASPATVDNVRRHSDMALSLDPDLVEALVSRATIGMYSDHDWPRIRADFERAISLQPGLSKTHRLYGSFLSAMGEHDAAIKTLRRAVELDSGSPRAFLALAEAHVYARRYDEAIGTTLQLLSIVPGNFFVKKLVPEALLLQGKESEALSQINRLLLPTGAPGYQDARQWMQSYVDFMAGVADGPDDASQATQAGYYAMLGHSELAFAALERAFDSAADAQLPYLAVDPRLDSLRPDPRFAGLLERLNLQSVAAASR